MTQTARDHCVIIFFLTKDFDPMLELGPKKWGDKIHYFRELQLLKFSGRFQDRGFANVCWLVKGTHIPDG
jgi:hypothetical protein